MTPGGPQKMNIINESGLYGLTFRSRKPEAKKFRKWVTSEVLPSIRKKGGYLSKAATKDQISSLVAEWQSERSSLISTIGELTIEKLYTDKQLDAYVKAVDSIRPLVQFGELSKRNGNPRTNLRRSTLTAPPKKSMSVCEAIQLLLPLHEAGLIEFATRKIEVAS
jgi:hypothetical protein